MLTAAAAAATSGRYEPSHVCSDHEVVRCTLLGARQL